MSFESACPCLGPPAKLVRIRIGGSLGRCFGVLFLLLMAIHYYVIRSYARRSTTSTSNTFSGQTGRKPAIAMHHKVVLPCGAWQMQTADAASCSEVCSTSVSFRS